MKNKIDAFLDRGEIRDCFDIEFLVRRGVDLSGELGMRSIEFKKKLSRFKERDFTIKLGSILESDIRGYYIENRFRFLDEELTSISNKP